MERCCRCGRFLTEVDCSTENGFDYDVICTNPKCREIDLANYLESENAFFAAAIECEKEA